KYDTTVETGPNGEKLFLTFPDWSTFDPKVALKELEELFALGRSLADEDAKKETHSFVSIIGAFEEFAEKVNRVFGPLQHLNAAMQTDEVKEIHIKAVALRADFESDITMHEGLYRAYLRYREGGEYQTLGAEEKKIVDDTIEGFELAGVGLSVKEKRKLKMLNKRSARLSTCFGNNAKESMKRWTKLVTDETLLSGVPEVPKSAMKDAAKEKKRDGFLVSLQSSIAHAIIAYADNRALRKEVYVARAREASDLGPSPKRLDNRPIIEAILHTQYERARLLGYANFAELSLRKKMARFPKTALTFIDELAKKSHTRAREELATLEVFAARELGLAKLEPWDVAYASEKLSIATFSVSQEELRPYFTATRVFDGMFKLVEQLYGISIEESLGAAKPSVWDPSVRFFRVYDKAGTPRAAFYADLYERSSEKVRKNSGAWADGCLNRRKLQDGIQVPVAYLNCNVTPPSGGKDGQFTHDEVVTLFHEFGHDLHHMLGLPNYAASNWERVEWDAIELPSQFMENFCWNREMLKCLSSHVDTKEQIPDELCGRLIASKHFQAGMNMAGQLEYGLFDLTLYTSSVPCDIDSIARNIRRRVRVLPVYKDDRFPNTFGHIFGGGYAAGYFSYKWAEVLSADAYEAFEETGDIYNKMVADKFMTEVLEASGKRKMAESYPAFRGRMPSVDALLRQSGLLEK
ncbi:MAG: M3 family metallopeptidase, partial [Patescibacteria group bacterium]